MSDASRGRTPSEGGRHRPMRLLHLMGLVAAIALTLAVLPALSPALRSGFGGAYGRELLKYRIVNETSLALILWTPALALIAVLGGRPRLPRLARSYGTASAFAASSALVLLSLRCLSYALIQ
jgi:hypothetical protein